MILTKLTVDNFRQFYAKQEIIFSTDATQNITLIHAENGVGKTAILNSILWCLFEETTENFERPDEIRNHEAQKEGNRAYFVGLEFEHEKIEYRVVRGADPAGQKYFRAFKIVGGNNIAIEAPTAFVNSIIPKDMAHYFFFHGEGVTNITSSVNHGGIREAIKDVLGFSLAEQAIEDLRNYKLRIGKEASQKTPNADFKAWDMERERYETAIKDNKAELENFKNAEKTYRREIERLENELREAPRAKDHQKERDRLTEQLRRANAELLEAKASEISLIPSYGWAVFGAKLAEESLEFIDESTLKGKIPSPYNEQLVKDLLEKRKCICERSLMLGTDEYKAVFRLLETAGNADLLNRVLKARTAITRIEDRLEGILPSLQSASSYISKCNNSIRELEQKLAEVSEKLKGISIKEINEKEEAYQRSRSNLEQNIRRQAVIANDLEAIERNIEDVEVKIKRAMTLTPVLNRLNKKSEYVENLIDYITKYLEDHEKNSRQMILKNINETLQLYSRKDYAVKMDENYGLHLIRNDGGIVAKSDGERLLLSLSFISALIWYAGVREKAESDVLISGVVAPFVIDAPFGELDETYKEATASLLPKRAKQVVLLLSSSHWKGTVDRAIRDKVGKEYVFISRKTVARGSKPLDELTIGNKAYQQSVYEADIDTTKIIQVG